MSFANPTRLRIGMQGSFGGKSYRIAGRSVLGEIEDGEVYYWNEYNLQTDTGEAATLVYDETERASQWRLFTQFAPDYPMTAAEAAAKSVGDRLNLTGHDVRVTFRGYSQVYYVEGQPPDGEGVGTTAQYFNAGSGHSMQVVSWTGDDVEFYNGVNLTAGMVASAFGVSGVVDDDDERRYSSFSGGSGGTISGLQFGAFVAFALVVLALLFHGGWSPNYEAGPVARFAAAPRPLNVGAFGTLFDNKYHITGHAVVELAEVGSNWERHEYELTDDSGAKCLLACGEKRGDTDWTLYERLDPMIAPTAKEAAAKVVGDKLDLDGFNGAVREIVLSTVMQSDGYALSGPGRGAIKYGLVGTNEYRVLLARWDAGGIQYFRGRTISAKTAAVAFGGAQ